MINYSWAGFDLHFKLRHHIVNFYLPVNQQIFQQQVRHWTFIRYYAAVWRLHCPLQISTLLPVSVVCKLVTLHCGRRHHGTILSLHGMGHTKHCYTVCSAHVNLVIHTCFLICICLLYSRAIFFIKSMFIFIHLHDNIIKYSNIFHPWLFSKIKNRQVKTQDTGRVGMKVHKTLGWSSANPPMNPNNVLCLLFPCHHAHWILARCSGNRGE